MKIKTLVAAVALVAASNGANAAIANGNTSDGELFLTVFDPSAEISYHMDTGISMLDFLADPVSLRSFDLTTDANYTQFVGQTDLRYSVSAGYNNAAAFTNPGTYGLLLTSNEDVAVLENRYANFNEVSQSVSTVHVMSINLNADAGDNADFAANNSATAVIGDTGYYVTNSWDTLNSSGFTISSNVDTSLAFYHIGLTNDFLGTQTDVMGSWTLSSAGVLAYAPAVSAVPVPAAVWLFGSGLIGLAGIARRKKA